MISLLTGMTIAKENKKIAADISIDELIARVEHLARVVSRSRGLIDRFERVASNVEPAQRDSIINQITLASKIVNNLDKRFAKIMTGVNAQRQKGLPSAEKQLNAPVKIGGFGLSTQSLVIEECITLLENLFNDLKIDADSALPSVYRLPVPATGSPYRTAA